MAAAPCVVCGQPAPAGSLACPHCGAEHPHRSRPTRAQQLVRRRRLLLGAAVAFGLLLLLVLVKPFGGGGSEACRDRLRPGDGVVLPDDADPDEPVPRPRPTCDGSER